MPRYIFEGASDDTFGEYGITNDDCDNCSSGDPISFTLQDPESRGGLLITGIYGNDALPMAMGWFIGASTLNEDIPVDWKVTLEPCHKGYRGRLTVETPHECTLECMNRLT